MNKQLISHHFGGKDGLYRALVARWLSEEATYGGEDAPLAEVVTAYAHGGVEHRMLHRLLLRASLDEEEEGGGLTPDDVEAMRHRQAAGEVTSELDPAFVLLALQAVTAAGVVFPGDVRRTTGLDPALPEYAQWSADQLRRLVSLLGGPGR